jgi:hypothetical protein
MQTYQAIELIIGLWAVTLLVWFLFREWFDRQFTRLAAGMRWLGRRILIWARRARLTPKQRLQVEHLVLRALSVLAPVWPSGNGRHRAVTV